MALKSVVKFECSQCGSNELGYQKYVKCLTPVTIKDGGQLEYGPSQVDEDDYLCTGNGFICKNCKGTVEHCGYSFEEEKELMQYLTMDPLVQDKEQREYEEHITQVIKLQEEQENITADYFEDEFDPIK